MPLFLAEAAEAPHSSLAECRDECERVDDSTLESNSKRTVEQQRGGWGDKQIWV